VKPEEGFRKPVVNSESGPASAEKTVSFTAGLFLLILTLPAEDAGLKSDRCRTGISNSEQGQEACMEQR
jgi:hypothetical protein